MTILGSLHSVSIRSPFRLCAPSVALNLRPPPRQTFSQLACAVSRKTGLPQHTPRDRTAQSSTPPSLPLHSGSQVSSLRGIKWRDRSRVSILRTADSQFSEPKPRFRHAGLAHRRHVDGRRDFAGLACRHVFALHLQQGRGQIKAARPNPRFRHCAAR